MPQREGKSDTSGIVNDGPSGRTMRYELLVAFQHVEHDEANGIEMPSATRRHAVYACSEDYVGVSNIARADTTVVRVHEYPSPAVSHTRIVHRPSRQ